MRRQSKGMLRMEDMVELSLFITCLCIMQEPKALIPQSACEPQLLLSPAQSLKTAFKCTCGNQVLSPHQTLRHGSASGLLSFLSHPWNFTLARPPPRGLVWSLTTVAAHTSYLHCFLSGCFHIYIRTLIIS